MEKHKASRGPYIAVKHSFLFEIRYGDAFILDVQLAVLDKSNVVGIFSEATATDVKTVLAYDAKARRADATAARTFSVAFRVRSPDGFVTHDCKMNLKRTAEMWVEVRRWGDTGEQGFIVTVRGAMSDGNSKVTSKSKAVGIQAVRIKIHVAVVRLIENLTTVNVYNYFGLQGHGQAWSQTLIVHSKHHCFNKTF